MAWTKAKAAIVVGVLLASGTTTVLIQKQNAAKPHTMARAPWSDAGAATPRAAIESLAWALLHEQYDRAQELIQWDEKGVAFARDPSFQHQITLRSVLAPALKDIESFRVLSIEPAQQPNELMVKIEKQFTNNQLVPYAVTAKLRRVGGHWCAVGNIDYSEGGGVSMLLPFTGSF